MLRYLTAGESHGPALVAVLEGLPAGVPLTSAEIARELARRRLGYGRGKRMRFEQDELEVLGGLRHGRTLGSPLAIRIDNSEWPKWTEVMSPDPVEDPEAAATGRGVPLTRPRPGHADLTGMQKYGFYEARPVLERASARETAARVAAGAAAKALLGQVGVSVLSHVVRLGPAATRSRAVPTLA
ncbi:MAG TPA: chorismate synthase, partial [Actinomycetes bacterium]|nr:chorismate synthase [Actinomycetes bacterium]